MPTIRVQGTVANTYSDKFNIVKFWETYEVNGTDRHRLWTAWADSAQAYNQGDIIEVTGDLGTKVGTFNKPGEETRSVVEHSLNNVTIVLKKAADPKEATKPVEEEMPF